MYPIGIPTVLNTHTEDDDAEKSQIVHLACNRERDICVVLWRNAVALYFTFPQLCLISHFATDEELDLMGDYECVMWKPDSTALLVRTSKNFLLLYKVKIDWELSYRVFQEAANSSHSSSSNRPFITRKIPAVQLTLTTTFLICLKNGFVHRFLWDGQIVEELAWSVDKVPFYFDQLQSRAQYANRIASDCSEFSPSTPPTAAVCFVDICHSSFVGGFLVVLNDGRAALLTALSPRFHPSELRAIWAPNVNDACCCSTNHKYRLLAIGCKDSSVLVFHVDDTTGALVLTYRTDLNVIGNPELTRNLGPVQSVKWAAPGNYLLVSWRAMGIGCWSVFGSRLWFKPCLLDRSSNAIRCFDWGPEGHHVWFTNGVELFVVRLLSLCDTNSVVLSDRERIGLYCDDQIYLSPDNGINRASNAEWPLAFWHQIQVPLEYLNYCWPIRVSQLLSLRVTTVSLTCYFDAINNVVCVVGSRGFAYHLLTTRKWRLFTNEVQERQLVVGSAVRYWNGYIICSCYDFEDESDELRFYPTSERLDSDYCTRLTLESPVLLLSLREEVLLTFDLEAKCILYYMSIIDDAKQRTINVEKKAIILVSDLVPHPFCVASVHIISRQTLDCGEGTFCGTVDTLLLNVAGRVIMLTPQTLSCRRHVGDDVKASQLEAPLLIASFVEQIWCGAGADSSKPHLSQAIWINSGSRGMLIWMPLMPRDDQQHLATKHQSFISKWIMLGFQLSSLHPSVVCSLKCFFLGVESETDCSNSWIEHKREVFLHHILKQLLRRNLGIYALDIANTCRDLPHFQHCLELLLHSVLEEEGTCSEPIPDPQLPRVIEFLREFPEFLQVIAYCARKTEMALWKYLFQYVGSPKQLFQICLKEKQLETAACYFIILQSMESSSDSKKVLATELLKSVLNERRWNIANEIIRFLKSIDPSDLDSPPTTPLIFLKQSAQPRISILSPTVIENWNGFMFANASGGGGGSRSRNQSGTSHTDSASRHSSAVWSTPSVAEQSISHGQQQSNFGLDRKSDNNNSMDGFVQIILADHAKQLIANCRLYDLIVFADQVNFNVILWLNQQRHRAAKVVHFPTALRSLHSDFSIAYPLPDTNFDISYLGASTLQLPSSAELLETSNLLNGNGNGNIGDDDLSLIESLSLVEPKGKQPFDSAAAGQSNGSVVVDTLKLELLDGELLADDDSRRKIGNERMRKTMHFVESIMIEAACLDWLLLIDLVLRDLRNFQSLLLMTISSTNADEMKALDNGLTDLIQWAEKDWYVFAYVPFFKAVRDALQHVCAERLEDDYFNIGNGNSATSMKSVENAAISVSSTLSVRELAIKNLSKIESKAAFSETFSSRPQLGRHYVSSVEDHLINPVSPSEHTSCSMISDIYAYYMSVRLFITSSTKFRFTDQSFVLKFRSCTTTTASNYTTATNQFIFISKNASNVPENIEYLAERLRGKDNF
ncbi:Protein RIC1 -like protein [Trichinella sp. T9]|nr:Protein RIC1 -like protein [Trichinella sp. T9]